MDFIKMICSKWSDKNKAFMLKDSDSLKQPIDIISVIEQSQKE